jgi:hypothetical protein
MKVKIPAKDRVSLEQIAINTKEVINIENFFKTVKRNPQDFTRKRKLKFIKLVLFMLNIVKSSSQTALNRFFDLLPNQIYHFSQQALSKAKKKISSLAFKLFFIKNVEVIYDYGYVKWHDY